jgi:hypothetical protein
VQLVKTLVAALVGAGLGIGLMIALEAYARLEFGWIVVVVGLLAGLAMRWIASTGRASYLRGALAALLTLVVFIAGKYAVATVIANQRDQVVPPPTAGPVEDDRETDTDDAPAVVPAELDLPARDATAVLETNPNNLDVNPLDAVWLVVGALVAYQLGKGGSARPAAEASSAADDTEVEEPLVRGDDPSN